MVSAEEEFIGALGFDVCHYIKTFLVGDNFYLVDMWDKGRRKEFFIYYVHESYTAYSLVIGFTADHERGKYFVEVRYKYPRHRVWLRRLSREQYNILLENILRLIKYSEKEVGSDG